MKDLSKLKKKLFPVVIEHTILIVALILILPTLIKPFFYKTPLKSFYSSRMNNRALIGAPLILYWGLSNLKRLICVFVDEKQEEKKTIIIKSSRKRKECVDLRPLFLPFREDKHSFHYWKVKKSKYMNLKFIVPDTIKGPKGYVDSYYLVTYYKNSKMVTEIKGPLNPKKISIISGHYIYESNDKKDDLVKLVEKPN